MTKSNARKNVRKLKGPIMILGAGGFIGINLLKNILAVRVDVFGVSHDPDKNWRFKLSKIPKKNLLKFDLENKNEVQTLIKKYKPKTIFNLAAYGAYSKQKKIDKIYQTNFVSTVYLLEALKQFGFSAYIHAGSQSEYGLNSRAPGEGGELIPNSHYAVSKVGNYFTVKYYGKTEKLPVVHLRFYSVYGPWEEPDRLIPVLLSKARKGDYPVLVDPTISRDFIYIDDIVEVLILTAVKMHPTLFGEAFNIATGKKTTIKELAYLVEDILDLPKKPKFGGMKNRDWDFNDWFGNPKKIAKILGWKSKTSLEQGLKKTLKWQKEIDYDRTIAEL